LIRIYIHTEEIKNKALFKDRYFSFGKMIVFEFSMKKDK